MRRERLGISLLLFVTAAFLSLGGTAFSQVTTAAIHGTVTDASGAVVPGARVMASNTATGISTAATTDKSGYYIIPQLQVGGPYTVTISATGFQSFSTSGITLNANANREVSAGLKIGTEATTVQVIANTVQVETSNTQLEQVATASQLEALPLAGRDPVGMQKLAPGVMESSDRDGTFASNGSEDEQNNYLLDGADINDSALQDEGFVINPDALQEVNIVESTMNPEFSRNSGAVVNEVVKSGTNQIHGSGFEFYRDTFLDAIPDFSIYQPVYHQNLFGGTLGFPIVKNRLFGFVAYQGMRNRTAQTENQATFSPDQFTGNFTNDTNWGMGFAPNSAGLTSNPIPFAFGSCTAGEAWNACFPVGESGTASVNIPTSQWNSIASALITKYVPQGNTNGDTYYDFNALNTEKQDQGVLRADYTATANDKFWGSGMFQAEPSYNELAFGGGSFPGFAQIADSHFKIFSGDWTHAFNANLLNDLHGGYYRLNFPAVIPAQSVQPSSLGFNIAPELPLGAGVPYIGIGGLFSLGFSFEGPQPRTDTNLTYADSFTVVRGNHNLKLGASFEQFRVHNPFGYLNNGDFSFYGGLAGGGEYSSGDPAIDFVLGIPDTYAQTNDGFIDAVANEIYAYGQDNWKVGSDLTLNFGVAWDVEQPFQNRQYNGYGIICYSVSSATSKVYTGGPPGLFWNGDPSCNQAGGVPTRFDHFGPRVGFAWSPSNGPSALLGQPGSHSFSVRGGFGVYYNRDQEEQSLQNLVDPPALLESHGAADFVAAEGAPVPYGSPGFANPFADVAGYGSESNLYPYSPPKPGGSVNWDYYSELELSAFSNGYNVPYAYNFNLNIQRALPGAMVMQIGYVGSIGHRLPTWFEGDPITAAGHTACLANPTCVQYISAIHLLFPQYTAQPAAAPSGAPWYMSVANQNSEGASNYNSLQASVVKSPTHGLQFTLAYTYAHALDNTSGYEDATGGDSGYGNGGRVYNYVPGFQYLNYGDSNYDARQRLVASYVYTVPIAGILQSNAILREGLSGWGVSGLTAVQDGFPVDFTMGADLSGWCDGYSYFGCPDVPELSTFNIKKFNPRASSSHQFFDTSVFSPETLGTFGNAKRNFFHGPGFNYTNLDLIKNIPLTPDNSRYVQLRIEAFNAFNHANFAPPGGSMENSANLGQIFGDVNNVIYSADPNADPQPGRAFQLVGKIYF